MTTAVDWNTVTDEEARLVGCPSIKCEHLTVCDFCGQLVCLEHTDDAVRCEEGPLGPGHHYDCADQCDHCRSVRAADAMQDLADAMRKGEW